MAAQQLKGREKFHFWSTQNQYALALVCWSNTFGNARKFPELLYKYGNIQVLLPYAVVTVFLVIPMAFAEMAIGQYSNNGFVNVWRMAPILRGITWAIATLTYFTTHYSLFTTSHAGYYFLKSFETTLPWSRCDPNWSEENCIHAVKSYDYMSPNLNLTTAQNSVEHFYRVLVLSENAERFAEVNVRLFIFLLATLAIVGVWLMDRIRSIEKLLTILTLTPFILLLILTIAALLNQTTLVGILAFITPDFQLLLDYRMWVEVVNNALTNLGIGMGGLVCIAAHGHFRSNIYNLAVLVPLCNLLLDVLFGLFVYASIATSAENEHITFKAVFEQDISLLFVKIPLVLLEWPSHQQLWTITYFLLLYIIGIRYLLFQLFTLTSAFHETFHCVYSLRRFSIAVLCFLIVFAMPLYISPVGETIFKDMEYFCSSTFITFVASIEAIGIFYIYDARKLIVDVHFMLNKNMRNLQYLFYVIPLILCTVTIANIYDWILTVRSYKTFWIFIIQCAVSVLMIVFIVSHLITYAVMHWEKHYKWMLSPTESWGCSNEDMKTNRAMFKSENVDATFNYRQQLYEQTIN